MKFKFRATIVKVGVNPCVDVPHRITKKMIPLRGYIPVKGNINRHSFIQTLCPVKNAPYRLYVNGPMLKGSSTKPGDRVLFEVEQDFLTPTVPQPMVAEFRKELITHNLLPAYEKLIPSRKKEILRYLNNLKSPEALERNIQKIIQHLQDKSIALLWRRQ